MSAAADVAAVIVTRGDVDLDPCLVPLSRAGLRRTVVYDNSWRKDLAVYGRYAAIKFTDAPVILVQDDDVILPAESIEALIAAYEPGKIVANMPERFRPHYPDSCLVGFGAIFDRDLPEQTFRFFSANSYGEWRAALQRGDKFASETGFGDAETWLRTCDVIFTTLTPRVLLDLDYKEREFASAPNRMWKQPGHVGERTRMLELARRVRDSVTA